MDIILEHKHSHKLKNIYSRDWSWKWADNSHISHFSKNQCPVDSYRACHKKIQRQWLLMTGRLMPLPDSLSEQLRIWLPPWQASSTLLILWLWYQNYRIYYTRHAIGLILILPAWGIIYNRHLAQRGIYECWNVDDIIYKWTGQLVLFAQLHF